MNSRVLISWLLALASLVIIFAGLISAKTIVIPILLAVFFSVLIAPWQAWLIRLGLPVALSVGITLISVVVIFSVLIDILIVSMTSLISDLPQLTQGLTVRFEQIISYLPDNAMSDWLDGLLQPSTALNLIKVSLSNLLSVMNNFLLVVMLIFFMLLESSRINAKLSKTGTAEAMQAFSRFSQKVNSYMLYKGLFSAMTGILVAVGLWMLKIDYAVLWGFLAFLLNFIPTIGSIIAAIPPLLLIVVSGTVIDAVLVALLFLVINIVIGNIIEPKYMGQGMGLSALVVFISLIFWGWVFGVVGMFLAVPLTMVVKIGLDTCGHKQVASLLEP